MAVIDSLISYWSLGEASGTRNDSHGTNHLTDNNTVGSATGKVGTCADFDAASSEYFSVASNATVVTGDIDFSIAAWVRFESLGASDRGFAGKFNNATANREYLLRYVNGASFQFAVSPEGATISSATSSTGIPSLATWYYVVGWHDSVNNLIGISVNGGASDTASYAGGVFAGAADFWIGRFNAVYHDGLVDEAALWKKVLTPADITWLYNAGNGRSYADIVTEASSGCVIRGARYRGRARSR